MNSKEYRRKERIDEISAIIKSSEQDGEIPKRNKLITVIMYKYNVSRKTALDYLNVAQYQNELR